ncbi:MAG TPA: diacylglycerol kinase family protein [Croceibacterium sp.]|nr:diacylglycerol kinase family protein [Croceibacterium sp.]
MPAAPLPVIVNAAGGNASRAGASLGDQIESAFAAAGRAIALELVEGDGLPQALNKYAGSPRVVVGGGDGTLATAAKAISSAGGEMAVLPLGTRNHFAGQLGIPPDLVEAAELAANGGARRVDLGRAGDRVFINNLSVGAYVDLVRAREASPLPKLLATVPATWRTLRKLRSRRFELTIDGERSMAETPLLFVGNNRYEVEEGRPGERGSLEDGMLSVYAIAPLSRTALIAVALRTLVARPRMHRDFVLHRTAREVIVQGPGAKLEIALDGERCRFELPLTIRIEPQALAVVSPLEID